jgi:putative pyruvate formate lyase activating enzyme
MIESEIFEHLEHPMVLQIFPRYLRVAANELPANFQIAKRVEFDFGRDMTDEEMWRLHKDLCKKFYELKNAVDAGKTDLQFLSKPRFSLVDLKIQLAKSILKNCGLCERNCGVDRTEGKDGDSGECGGSDKYFVSSEFMHHGEEFFISPSHTIFFMGCNLHCDYCQNWEISQWHEIVEPAYAEQIVESIEKMRAAGSRNVNFVGGEPTPSLLFVLDVLRQTQTNVPIVWNSNFYMSEKTMHLLDGIIDVYLSDFKYGNDKCARHLSKVDNYLATVKRNHAMAARQGELLIRHLVLPEHVNCCTKPAFDWISRSLRDKCMVNIMDQYRPEYKALECSMGISKPLSKQDLRAAVAHAKKTRLNFIK